MYCYVGVGSELVSKLKGSKGLERKADLGFLTFAKLQCSVKRVHEKWCFKINKNT